MKLFNTMVTLVFALAVLFVATSALSMSFPSGNYMASCWHCRIKHHKLICRCARRSGRKQKSVLHVPKRCKWVENIDGNLRCTQFRHRKLRWIKTGPIWNNTDANKKCRRVCGGSRRWTGQWRTVRLSVKSKCECRV